MIKIMLGILAGAFIGLVASGTLGTARLADLIGSKSTSESPLWSDIVKELRGDRDQRCRTLKRQLEQAEVVACQKVEIQQRLAEAERKAQEEAAVLDLAAKRMPSFRADLAAEVARAKVVEPVAGAPAAGAEWIPIGVTVTGCKVARVDMNTKNGLLRCGRRRVDATAVTWFDDAKHEQWLALVE